MSLDQLLGYYNVPAGELTLTQRRRMEAEHSTLMYAIEAHAVSLRFAGRTRRVWRGGAG